MKSFLFFLFFIGSALMANAQYGTAGQKVIGGSLGFYSGKNIGNSYPDYSTNTNGFSLSANAGKFTKKNVLSSVAVSYGHSFVKHNEPTSFTEGSTNNVAASYSKTYFKEVAKKLFFGIGGSLGAGYYTAKSSYLQNPTSSKSEGYGVNLGIAPILAYQVSNRFVINCSPSTSFLTLNYSNSSTKYYPPNQLTTNSKSSSVSLNTGFFNSPLSNLTLGFSYLLKQK